MNCGKKRYETENADPTKSISQLRAPDVFRDLLDSWMS